MITLSNGSITIRKNDGIILSGFPINNNYQNSILIADLLGDNSPEIISTTENTIEIISHEGKVLEEFPLYNPDSDLFIVSDIENNSTYLVNGNRSIEFNKYNENANYWLNPRSTTYNFPLVGVSRATRQESHDNWSDLIDLEDFGFNQSFNYPNPFEDSTVFRFYVSSAVSLKIKLYDISGFLIDQIDLTNLTNHQFNEYNYDASHLDSGLYIAELKSDNNQSEIIKLLKTK